MTTNDGRNGDDGNAGEPDDGGAGASADEVIPPPGRVLEEIGSTRPLEYRHLRALSDPSDETVSRAMALWPRIAPDRRRDVLARLRQLTEEDATLDFHRIHLSALHDPDVATRVLAVRGLWDQDRAEYMRLLIRQLRADPEASVRAEVADVLGQWVISMEFGMLAESDAEDLASALREAVEDIEEQDEVRARALEALAASSEEDVAELISEMYEIGNHRMRVAALRSMGRNASEAWLPVLIYHFDDDDAEIRAVCARSAGELLSDDAVAPLVMLLEDHDEDVQVAAIRALGDIGNDEAERVLGRLLRERSEAHLREAVRDALAEVQLLTMEMLDEEDRDPEFDGSEEAR